MGAITFNIEIGIANDASVKLSDKDGYSYVLINNAKVKDTTIAQNDSSLYTSGALTVTATVPVENSSPRTPTTDEYASIAGTYKVTITGANHTKVALTTGAAAIAVDLYEKYTAQDDLPEGKSVGDDKESLIAGNTVEVQFTVASSGITLASTTVYAAVQGAAGIETDETFTTSKPTVSTKLYVQGEGNTWTEIN